MSDGHWRDCFINDISVGGAEIAVLDGLGKGDVVQLKIDGFGDVRGSILRVTAKSCAIQFDLDADSQAELERHIANRPMAA